MLVAQCEIEYIAKSFKFQSSLNHSIITWGHCFGRKDYLPKDTSSASGHSNTVLPQSQTEPSLGTYSPGCLGGAIIKRQSTIEIKNEQIKHACHSSRLCVVANAGSSALFEPSLLGTI